MAVFTVASKKTTGTTYTVKGTTLADVWKDIEKKGPKIGSLNVAGLCTCNFSMDEKSSGIAFDMKEDGKGGFEAEARFSKGKIEWPCTIKMPKCSSVAKLSKDAQKEWKRFIKCTQTHEDGHVTEYKKEVDAIVKELEALRGKGKGGSEKDAQKAAFDDLAKTFGNDYSKDKLDKRLTANADAYDVKTKHGKTQGATLDTSIK